MLLRCTEDEDSRRARTALSAQCTYVASHLLAWRRVRSSDISFGFYSINFGVWHRATAPRACACERLHGEVHDCVNDVTVVGAERLHRGCARDVSLLDHEINVARLDARLVDVALVTCVSCGCLGNGRASGGLH